MRVAPTPTLGVFGTLAAVWVALVWASAAAAPLGESPRTVTIQGAQAPAATISPQTCKDCHTGAETERLPIFHRDCLTCHRGAKEHVAAPAVDNIHRPEPADCLTCHTRSAKLAQWENGPHSRNKVECRECHNPHKPVVRPRFTTVGDRRMDSVSAACVTCHRDTASRFALQSHHPLREGGISCVSCHDPHGRDGVRQLSKTDRCVTCHPAQRGPFVFEHAPVLEDCSNCHVPHGSGNRRLTELPSPSLCLQCHSLADPRHAQNAAVGARVTGAALRSCVGCHAAIHGSHNDPYLRF
ncbi:MAG: cytochrome c3 family protein [Mycobacterium sp.]